MSEQEQGSYRILGNVDDFPSFPATVTIDRDPFFLVQTNDNDDPAYRLVSAICPHAGGLVRPHENELICPLHFWAFDILTGESTNVPGEHLECRPVEIRDGQFAVLEK
ncbi:nitrite reductase/ring-hydroxylating ferredoxin subunit [Paenibacillus phyllosphaerae]|uniref:Nitrite reductase/ring-hydroxylating ferredoxin subunit n=1 Tax=Paenibacillus phyllosphaerae TaxID=274593 RepID=A0A7W5ATN1_9BACL|nr:Rieske (2Fe-2S) protein [Paenibacillus phyllosphaerae]MBB3108354.1 nitrite reductase/ring-hydroxylating ferredoxin subunit [Paenibacillus phyllosphaerae]